MDKQYRDVMVDLETLGTRPGCTVLSIGAVAFDEDGVYDEGFHVIVSRESCLRAGLHEDLDTLAWWEKRSDEAKVTLHAASNAEVATGLLPALASFSTYLDGHGGLKEVRVWGNGANFDQPILNAAYVAAGVGGQPWKFYNDCCYRTLKGLLDPTGSQFQRVGAHHNAHDDALSQAMHCSKLLKMLSARA